MELTVAESWSFASRLLWDSERHLHTHITLDDIALKRISDFHCVLVSGYTDAITLRQNELSDVRKVKVKWDNWAPCQEGVLVEWRYSSIHSLTPALYGGGSDICNRQFIHPSRKMQENWLKIFYVSSSSFFFLIYYCHPLPYRFYLYRWYSVIKSPANQPLTFRSTCIIKHEHANGKCYISVN
jgi:hypothetical protein